MHWVSQYIGLPYMHGGRDRAGVDCWGLVWLIYREQFSIDLPILAGMIESNLLEVCRVIEIYKHDWTQLDKPVDGCLVTLSQTKHPHHVGIWADADGGKLVHACRFTETEGRNEVVAETVKTLKLKGFRNFTYLAYGLHH